MCGIVGAYNKIRAVTADARSYRNIVDLMSHRGPDDWGIYVETDGEACEISEERPEKHDFPLGNSTIFLGHQRLSILDLSKAGHQPMSTQDGRFWIVYNGEIYNFREIRQELEGAGYRFSSKCDTEVLLYAYAEWGAECLSRLNGMFAFGIWDRVNRSFFLARDRLGIKPLYYFDNPNAFAFASEIKVLVSLLGANIEVDWQGILSHLLLLWSPDPKTAFQGIEKLPPGHWLLCRDGHIEIQSYWDVPFDPEPKDLGESVYLEQLCGLFQKAVERRMLSDVPVGAFLSGGLDSSLIAAQMSRLCPDPITAYTITFDEKDKAFEAMPDDQGYARMVASHIGADHREILVQPDIAQLLPKLIWHLDEPIADPAAINTYLICKAAKERGTTIMLSGMGADEIFAGYRKHLSVYVAGIYKRLLPSVMRERLVRHAVDHLPVAGRRGGYRLFRWAKRFAKSASLSDLECFIGNYSYYNAEEIDELLHPDLRCEWHKAYPIQRHYDHFAYVRNRDLVSQMTYLDAKLFLPGLNLAYSDKASMAASVEERVPFVDHEMVVFALNLPSRYRLRGLTQKYLLKKLGMKYLPKQIAKRPKAGFGAPLRAWMHRDLGPMVDDLLSEESVRSRGYFRYKTIRKMIDDNRNGRQDYGHRLWGLLTIELWHRIFIDGSIGPTKPLEM